MNKSRALSLLKVVQSAPDRFEFHASTVLKDFVEESGIGITTGSKVLFTNQHKDRIRAWLRADNVDPGTAPDAWDGLRRAEALKIGPDEKWARGAVRAERIAIKALSGKPLMMCGQSLFLPPSANIEWSFLDAVKSIHHDAIIVVENWEVFERIDQLQVKMNHVSENPLILWRGGASRTSVGAAKLFVEACGLPVWSAPDYDPEGLAIASRLPHLAGILAPSDDILRSLLKESKLHERYTQQLPGAKATLDQAPHPDVKRIWKIVRESRNALPQERLCIGEAPIGHSSPIRT